MKMTKREKALLILLLTVIAAIVLVFVFILPTNIETNNTRDSIERLKNDIEEAQDNEWLYNLMLAQKAVAEEDFIEKTVIIPNNLQDSQALRRLYAVMSPYTDDISLSFPESGEQQVDNSGTVTILPIEARLTVPSYGDLKSILSELTFEKTGCTVFDLSYRLIGEQALSVTMRIHFLKGNSLNELIQKEPVQ